MDNLILTPVPLENLLQSFREIIKEEIKAEALSELQEKLLSPEEACKLFVPKVTKPTLESWSKNGPLTKHYIGGRVFYKYSEIMASLKTLGRYKIKSQLAGN